MRTGDVVYLDSSALVKLVITERESEALKDYLVARPVRASCALAQVEVVRAAKAHGDLALHRARQVLLDTNLLSLDDEILSSAADLASPSLRSLCAVHVATALALRGDLSSLVTYDQRMARAARASALLVEAPGL